MSTLMLAGIAVAALLFLFRRSLGRIVPVAIVVLVAVWFYSDHNGDLHAMWNDLWATAQLAVDWLKEFANSFNGSTTVETTPAP